MIIKKAELETVCGITSTLPDHDLPEFAFAGKSNVGKSTLINAFVGRKALARVSSEPGKTQTINFYKVNDAFYLVDLPGYGYAKTSKETREKWGKMIEKYLKTSPVLKGVFLLVDMRHEPGENDLLMFDWIQNNGYEPYVIMTKADKLSKNEQFKMRQIIKKAFRLEDDSRLIAFSGETKQGLNEIQAFFEAE